ncbi:MAG: ribonuclease J [Proteobacteria bacterium]|nr:ribonuclease J [Pseudomonadota bacterium]
MFIPSKKDLWFLPLGGSGEIGMNLNLYGHDGQWLMVDCGITFYDRYGIEVITPDITFIEKHKEQLVGLVLTHAHEDHIGAIPYLWERFQCPLYATPFTAGVIRQKLKEANLEHRVPLYSVPLKDRFHIGLFDVEYVTLTHSIPEPNALMIRTPLGNIFHTGDWKIDPQPFVGEMTDIKRLQEIGQEGVLALVCDSTNAFMEGVAGSEEDVREELIDLLGKFPHSRIIVGCFASNIARIETIAMAAKENNRQVGLIGASLQRMVKTAKENGYLTAHFISDEVAMKLPRHEVVLITTGSQGEHRAALTRISQDQHPIVKLDSGDVVIFSSRVIPGNEKNISFLQNRLISKGIEVITSQEEDIHVSGHPGREELRQMYSLIKPNLLIPVHGEARHLHEQVRWGLKYGIKEALAAENGVIIQLSEEGPRQVGRVLVGRWGYDGNRLISLDSPIVKVRQKLSIQGAIFVTIPINKLGFLAQPPQITLLGITEEPQEKIEQEMHRVIMETLSNSFKNDEMRTETLRQAIRRVIYHHFEKKPLTEIHFLIV